MQRIDSKQFIDCQILMSAFKRVKGDALRESISGICGLWSSKQCLLWKIAMKLLIVNKWYKSY